MKNNTYSGRLVIVLAIAVTALFVTAACSNPNEERSAADDPADSRTKYQSLIVEVDAKIVKMGGGSESGQESSNELWAKLESTRSQYQDAKELLGTLDPKIRGGVESNPEFSTARQASDDAAVTLQSAEETLATTPAEIEDPDNPGAGPGLIPNPEYLTAQTAVDEAKLTSGAAAGSLLVAQGTLATTPAEIEDPDNPGAGPGLIPNPEYLTAQTAVDEAKLTIDEAESVLATTLMTRVTQDKPNLLWTNAKRQEANLGNLVSTFENEILSAPPEAPALTDLYAKKTEYESILKYLENQYTSDSQAPGDTASAGGESGEDDSGIRGLIWAAVFVVVVTIVILLILKITDKLPSKRPIPHKQLDRWGPKAVNSNRTVEHDSTGGSSNKGSKPENHGVKRLEDAVDTIKIIMNEFKDITGKFQQIMVKVDAEEIKIETKKLTALKEELITEKVTRKKFLTETALKHSEQAGGFLTEMAESLENEVDQKFESLTAGVYNQMQRGVVRTISIKDLNEVLKEDQVPQGFKLRQKDDGLIELVLPTIPDPKRIQQATQSLVNALLVSITTISTQHDPAGDENEPTHAFAQMLSDISITERSSNPDKKIEMWTLTTAVRVTYETLLSARTVGEDLDFDSLSMEGVVEGYVLAGKLLLSSFPTHYRPDQIEIPLSTASGITRQVHDDWNLKLNANGARENLRDKIKKSQSNIRFVENTTQYSAGFEEWTCARIATALNVDKNREDYETEQSNWKTAQLGAQIGMAMLADLIVKYLETGSKSTGTSK